MTSTSSITHWCPLYTQICTHTRECHTWTWPVLTSHISGYSRVTSHTWMHHVKHTYSHVTHTYSHVTHLNMTRFTTAHLGHACITSHAWMSHVTHLDMTRFNTSGYSCVMSHAWISHIKHVHNHWTHLDVTRFTTANLGPRMTYVTRINESCHTHEKSCHTPQHGPFYHCTPRAT